MSLYKTLGQIFSLVKRYTWEASRHHLTVTFLKLFGAKSLLAKLRYSNGVIMWDYSQICNQND